LNKGIGLHKIAFSVITVAIISLMVSPGSAYAASDACGTMEANLDKLSSGGYFSYLVQCTDLYVGDGGASSSGASGSGVLGSQTIVAAGANTQINLDVPGVEPIGVTPPNFGSQNTQSEVSIDSCGMNVVSGYNDSQQFPLPPPLLAGSSFTGYSYSGDGGATWTDGGILPAGTGVNFGDPSVKADPNNCNVFYMASLHLTAGGLNAISVSKSIDGGQTFGNPVVVITGAAQLPPIPNDFPDKELIEVSPNGDVHISLTLFTPTSAEIVYLRSTNGGTTWVDQHTFNPGLQSQGSIPVVDPSTGDVYVFYVEFPAFPFGNIMVSRNNNGGAAGSWSAPVTVAPTNPILVTNDNCQRFVWNGDYRFTQFPTASVNAQNGDIYVSWNDSPNAVTTDLVVYSSQNQGVNWAQVASPTPPDLQTDQYIPWMDTTPSGEIKMIWYDRINDPNNRATELFASSSNDGGATWQAPFLVSTAPFLPPPFLFPNPDPLVASCYFVGEYNQIHTPDDLIAHVAWGDGRVLTTGPAPQPQPDVFYSKLQQFVEPKPTPQPPVGGEFLPIDSTALLLAGMQTNSVWILSALAAVGITAFGALYISVRRK